jgi:phospholipid/cholesterol/gamma-HCH transport system substrate-binding protein
MDLYKQEIGVGAVVLAGIALFVVGMLWLSGRTINDADITVDVVFASASGLRTGDPVAISGLRRGRVSRMRLRGVGQVVATIELFGNVRPRIDASAAIKSLDFFGARMVDYNPGKAEQFLPPDRPIVGTIAPDFTEVAADMAVRANEVLGNASALLSEEFVVDLRNTLVSTQRAMNTLAATGSGSLVQQTTATLARTERLMARLDSVFTAAAPGQRVDTISRNLAVLTNHLGQATASLDTLLGRMNRGEGTLGRMASDTALYGNLNTTLAALTALLTDLRERPGRYLTVKVF